MTRVHPIEIESYRRLRELVDLSHLPPLSRAVTERIIHASADLDYVHELVLDEAALAAGIRALRAGAPLVADVEMVAAGITGTPTLCALRDPRTAALAAQRGLTRSAAGIHVALEHAGPGAVWVVGCAPTALFALVEADARAALVVGLPVGFVGAVESKEALLGSGLPALTNRSRKGGSAVAAAAANALLRHAKEEA
ncbi:MAG: precorrin-8X methylmutase [Thermoleophilaceae bacterium]